MRCWSLVVVAAFLTLTHCRSDEELELPPQDTLIDIFLDLHLAEASITRVPHTMRDSIGNVVRGKIAAKYGLAPDEMQDIVAAVQRDPATNIAIYDSVIHRLQGMKESTPFSRE